MNVFLEGDEYFSVESRYGQLEVLLDHFTMVMNKKDKLLSQLQATAVEKSLNIEAQYHK